MRSFISYSSYSSYSDVEVGEIAKLADDELEKHLVQNATEHMKREELTKLHLKEVEVITGEEGERNVLQVWFEN